ncbi:hypothetical protein ACFVWX_23030 [Streptomyces sp. NPDC058220]|uniref:hypothetical protein n=1 Tax=Streptomyces sp. NPDC058220 TaxID=3346387 RepID=UPI0036E67AC7
MVDGACGCSGLQIEHVEAARESVGAELRMPELLANVTTQIVVPVTALPGPNAGEPCEDTFALEALRRVFVTSLRIWTQAGPDAAEGIARAVIDFAAQFLTEDHEDVAEILRQLGAGAAVHSPGSAANAPHKERSSGNSLPGTAR